MLLVMRCIVYFIARETSKRSTGMIRLCTKNTSIATRKTTSSASWSKNFSSRLIGSTPTRFSSILLPLLAINAWLTCKYKSEEILYGEAQNLPPHYTHKLSSSFDKLQGKPCTTFQSRRPLTIWLPRFGVLMENKWILFLMPLKKDRSSALGQI